MNNNISIYLTDRILCSPTWSWNSSTNGWKGYHIWCVDGGHARVQVREEEYLLYEGDIFLFDLNENHICTHNPEQPLKVSTIYFDVSDFAYQALTIRQSPFFVEIVHRVVSCIEKEEIEMAQVWLKALLTEFENAGKKSAESSGVVRKICTLMEEKIFEPLTLGEVADYTGYSKNQIIRLFRKEIGCTPMQYFMRKKITYAKSQLVYSSQTLHEISNTLGFSDESYFGKVFKEQVGCSPGSYREQSKL